MKKYLVIALLSASCGGTSTAPSVPLLQPSLSANNGLLVNGCVAGSNGLFTCAVYNGTATNAGPGCGVNVHGVVTTYTAAGNIQVGSSEWSYNGRVKVGEQIAYAGTLIVVPGPISGDGSIARS